MKNIKKYIILFIIPLCSMMISCNEDKYDTSESPDLTYIRNIRILNVADTVIYGKVDELKKEIKFPKLDSLSDLRAVRFEADLPQGAHFDQETYDFSIPKGETQNRRIVSVVNGKRKREYYVTIRLSVPVFGADFAKAKVYDHSGNTTCYPDFTGANTRNADMDTTHVLIVSRDATGPHLLKILDLKENRVEPIKLDLTGVSGGTFAYSSGHLSHGHIYIVNLQGVAGELSIYHWDSPSATPTKIFAQIPNTFGATAGRFGDDMSMDIDENGNGYIYLGNNQSTTTGLGVLRIKVTGFTTLTEPTLLTLPVAGGMWINYNLVDGSDAEYTFTGPSGPVVLVGNSGNSIYQMANDAVPLRSADAHIINYNDERYLAMTTGNPTGAETENAIYIYDITKGETSKEALELFEAGNRSAKYKFNLKGSGNTSVYTASFAYGKTENALYLLGAAPYGGGFVVIEVPKASEIDDFYEEDDIDWQ
ncbi:MAG: DUF4623 domain-containing protein [Prevotellaceae bacterium]|jgi:hypothetical protein|nr:DUF4623 domain-containing protein [Prevotellaceae bacterium]